MPISQRRDERRCSSLRHLSPNLCRDVRARRRSDGLLLSRVNPLILIQSAGRLTCMCAGPAGSSSPAYGGQVHHYPYSAVHPCAEGLDDSIEVIEAVEIYRDPAGVLRPAGSNRHSRADRLGQLLLEI